MKDTLLTSYKSGWESYFTGSIKEWVEGNVVLPHTYAIPGSINLGRSKFLWEPYDSLKNPYLRQINCMSAVQCCKTLLAETYLPYLLINDVGTLLWLQSSDEMAKRMSDTRMVPLMLNCKAIKDILPKDKNAMKKLDMYFDHFNIHINGAKESALQSLSIKFLIGDECWLWEEGYMLQAKARTRAFPHTCKILFISQGGIESDEWNREFERGVVKEWGWKCPNCGKVEVLDFQGRLRDDNTYGGGIVWSREHKKDGKWNYLEAGKSAYLECFSCRHRVTDNPQSRRYLNDTGQYVITQGNGDPTVASYRWNALANMDISFSSLVIKYLQAKESQDMEGNKIPLMDFYQKDLGRPWDTSFQIALSKMMVEEYNPTSNWDQEAFRFMTIDCQSNFETFYYVIRAWSKNSESRLIKIGKAAGFDELAAIQKEFGVRDQNVLIDSGYRASDVYKECIKRGHVGTVGGKKVWLSWVALKGWDSMDFTWPGEVKKLFSTETRGDPNMGKEARGKTCPLYRWSNYSVKNILTHLRDGKGAKWVCAEHDEEYEKQLNSEILQREIDSKSGKEKWRWVQKQGVQNHFWDCECMQVTAAAMVGILGNTDKKL